MVYVKQPRIKNNTSQQMKKVTSFKLKIIRKLSLQEWKFAHRVGFSVVGKIIKGLRLWMPGYLGILPQTGGESFCCLCECRGEFCIRPNLDSRQNKSAHKDRSSCRIDLLYHRSHKK